MPCISCTRLCVTLTAVSGGEVGPMRFLDQLAGPRSNGTVPTLLRGSECGPARAFAEQVFAHTRKRWHDYHRADG